MKKNFRWNREMIWRMKKMNLFLTDDDLSENGVEKVYKTMFRTLSDFQ